MVRSVLFLATWGALTFGVVIGMGALFGARPAVAGTEWDVVRWPAGQTVAVCTRQSGRPSWITEEQFSEVVSQTAERWSELAAGVRIDYRLGCDIQSASPASGVTEISWDFGTFLDRPGVDSITELETLEPSEGTVGQIIAGRIVLRPWSIGPTEHLGAQVEALRGLLGHEFGHLLGLSHSDVQSDLMYGGPVTAREPSTADAISLTTIYGSWDDRTLSVQH